MFETAVVGWCWYHHFGLVFFGGGGRGGEVLGCVAQGEKVDVHLGCEAFG